MKKLNVCALACLISLGGCASTEKQSAELAESCNDAEIRGAIFLAEKSCEQAWFEVNHTELSPASQSMRLYDLARIKRQLNKFDEALIFIEQAVKIEAEVSGTQSVAYAERQLEHALVLTGLKKYDEGIIVLTALLDTAQNLEPRLRRTTANTLSYYVNKVKSLGQGALAKQFADKSRALRSS